MYVASFSDRLDTQSLRFNEKVFDEIEQCFVHLQTNLEFFWCIQIFMRKVWGRIIVFLSFIFFWSYIVVRKVN